MFGHFSVLQAHLLGMSLILYFHTNPFHSASFFNPRRAIYQYIGALLDQFNDYNYIQIPHEEIFHSKVIIKLVVLK